MTMKDCIMCGIDHAKVRAMNNIRADELDWAQVGDEWFASPDGFTAHVQTLTTGWVRPDGAPERYYSVGVVRASDGHVRTSMGTSLDDAQRMAIILIDDMRS